MKLFIATFCFTAALLATTPLAASPQAANPQTKNDGSQSKPTAAEAPAAKAEAPLTKIPASAVQFEPGSYHYTDANGKKWILRPTPFGISKVEDTGAAAKKIEDHSLDNAKITEDGDSVKFERPGPFGVYKWEKKKTDLDAGEKAAWEREQAKKAGQSDRKKTAQDQKK